MSMMRPKLTTAAACHVARIHRDRFNEHVAAGRYPCAPDTIAGRTRLFDPDDMIGLWLFRELIGDGLDAHVAGHMACSVADCARQNPDKRAVAYVQTHFSGGRSIPADQVPDTSKWDAELFSGADIRKVTIFHVEKLRELIAHGTEEERSIIGERE